MLICTIYLVPFEMLAYSVYKYRSKGHWPTGIGRIQKNVSFFLEGEAVGSSAGYRLEGLRI